MNHSSIDEPTVYANELC